MSETDVAFHDSFKPRWGTMDSIICARNDMTGPLSEGNKRFKERLSVFSEGRDVAVLQFVPSRTVWISIFPYGTVSRLTYCLKSSYKLLQVQKQ